MLLVISFFFLLGFSNTLYIPSRSPSILKEVHAVPRAWTRLGPAPAGQMINLHIGLKQTQMHELERHLLEVSDPDHARYGEHLSEAEVRELMKPANDTSHLVHEWLFDHGIDEASLEYSPAKDWINVILPLDKVEMMLETEYSIFEHDHGHRIIRTTKWSLPLHLHKHIDVLQPTTSFFRHPTHGGSRVATDAGYLEDSKTLAAMPRFVARAEVQQTCHPAAITPLCLRKLYGTFDYKPSHLTRDFIGVSNFLGESTNISDVTSFIQSYRPDLYPKLQQGSFIKFQSVANGENRQMRKSPEELAIKRDQLGDLVAETLIGISGFTPLTVYSTGDISPWYLPDARGPNNMNEPYLAWALYVIGQPSPPLVIATAYGDDEQTVPLNYARRVCGDFMALGAQGISLLFSSGNEGVGKDPYCLTNDGKNNKTYLPQFPASCPYVTTVGATQGINPEVVASNSQTGFASGGGFSNYFLRPQYQNTSVSKYLSMMGNQSQGLFNNKGRAYPDISAQGSNFVSVWNGKTTITDSTGASAATAAAIFALINDARLRNEQKPLGFLNPLIYGKMNRSFTDVKSGYAGGCGKGGFQAGVGWDAASGWGTPNFPKLCYLATSSGDCGYRITLLSK